jgi:hypothetical protein
VVRAWTLENDPEAGDLPSHQARAEDLLLREWRLACPTFTFALESCDHNEDHLST